MKNLFLFPTDKPSKLYFHNLNNRFGFSTPEPMAFFGSGSWAEGRNIYIISDEEIKVGDSIIDLDIKKTLKADKFRVITSKQSQCWYYKKIILSTDQDLIKDGVQAIDDEFLEWFVKNPSCERVETVFNNRGITGAEKILKTFGEYKIIIPKEETNGCIGSNGVSDPKLNEVQLNQPKQETLEEVAKKWNDNQTKLEFGKPHNASHRIKAFIAGYETAKQQMYSQEEVIEFTKWKNNNTIRVDLDGYKLLGDSMDLKSHTLKELLEIFKKN